MQSTMLIITTIFAFAMPIGLLIYWKTRHGLSLFPFLMGALSFLLFAMGLEQMLHAAVLGTDSPHSKVFQNNPWLYVAYGCLAAGIFEESGRFFTFKVLLRNYREKEISVAYGIGHGGIETILTLGLSYLLMTLVSLGFTIGGTELSPVLIESARTTTAPVMLLAMLERASAMMLHIALSIIVFTAANRPGKIRLYPLAIILHAAANIFAGMYQTGILTNIVIIELLTFLCSLCILLFGIRIYRRL